MINENLQLYCQHWLQEKTGITFNLFATNPKHSDNGKWIYQASIDKSVLSKNPQNQNLDFDNINIVELISQLPDNNEFEVKVSGKTFIMIAISPQHAEELFMTPKLSKFKDKTVIVDYSSPNVAKNMHIGHLRSTIIGDSIVRLKQALNYRNVILKNHVGDYGKQFALIVAYMLLKNKTDEKVSAMMKQPIFDLNEVESIYTEANAFDTTIANKIKQNENTNSDEKDFSMLLAECIAIIQNIQEDKYGVMPIYHKILETSYFNMSKTYEHLDVLLKPEHIQGESSYERMLDGVVVDLLNKNIAKRENDGVVVIPSTQSNEQALVIQRKNGSFLYPTTDLAALKYRVDNYEKIDEIIYVVDSRQSGHFEQIFKVGNEWLQLNEKQIKLTHVEFGTILGADKKPLRTRDGKNAKLQNIINEITAQTHTEMIENQRYVNRSEQEIKDVVKQISVGFLKFNELSRNRKKDYTFEYSNIMANAKNTGIYLQYTGVRLKSIQNKIKSTYVKHENTLTDTEQKLIVQVLRKKEILEKVNESYNFNFLCDYLTDLCELINKWYDETKLLNDENTISNFHYNLLHITFNELKKCMYILGIEIPNFI